MDSSEQKWSAWKLLLWSPQVNPSISILKNSPRISVQGHLSACNELDAHDVNVDLEASNILC